MPPATARTLTIVGAGHLGRTLGRLWHEKQVFALADVVTRSQGSADEAVAFIGAGHARFTLNGLAPADLVLIATGDDQIGAVCAALAQQGLFRAGQIVFHCSGALSSAELAPAAAAGAAVASVHPIRSFAQPAQVLSTFDGTWCGMEGEPEALALLSPAFGAIGARLAQVDARHKTLYHAAAVFASNYLVTLLDASLQAYEGAGVPRQQALQMVQPLVRTTLDNIYRAGPEAALSGPLARGDMQTVARQSEALQAYRADLGKLYDDLAQATADLARRARSKP
ncbi:MAG: hypothetical protein JWP36_941 [Paucimonas sp.]|nr:hypothetical protein [Paucimonas sp.]